MAVHVQSAAEIGRELTRAKEQCAYGQWRPFREHHGFSKDAAERYRRYARAVDDGTIPDGIPLRKALPMIAEKRKAARVPPLPEPEVVAPAPAVDRSVEFERDGPTAPSWLEPDAQEQAEREDPEKRVEIALWRLRELEGFHQRLTDLTDENTALKRRIRILEATVSHEAATEAERVAQEMAVMQSRIDQLTGDLGRANARIKHLLRERGQR